jgi:cell division protein FtsB
MARAVASGGAPPRKALSQAALGEGRPLTLVKPRLRLVENARGQAASSAARPTARPAADAPKPAGKSRSNNSFPSPTRRQTLSSSAPVLVLTAVAAVLLISGVVVGQVLLTQAAYSKSQAERELEEARAEYERARAEAARAEAPAEIDNKARHELGMIEAEQKESLPLGPEEPPESSGAKPEGTTSEPGPASGEIRGGEARAATGGTTGR